MKVKVLENRFSLSVELDIYYLSRQRCCDIDYISWGVLRDGFNVRAM